MKTVRTSEGFNSDAWYWVAGLVFFLLVLLVVLGIPLFVMGNEKWLMIGILVWLELGAAFGVVAYALVCLARWLVRKKEP